MKKILIRILCVVLVHVCLLGLSGQALAFTEEQQLFNEAWRIINQAYVDDSFNQQNWWKLREKTLHQNLNNRETTYKAIREMIAGLEDPFTRLLVPSQYQSLRTSTAGELTGVGLQITINTETDHLEVIAPIEGSPAAIAGLQPHDQILEIDHEPAANFTLDDAAERMRGEIGTAVTLTVQKNRSGVLQPLEEVVLKRDRIELHPVLSEVRQGSQQENIAYIRLNQFNANATREMRKAIQDLEQQGVAGYILDLRNNPGGLLQAGVDIAELWMDPQPIVYTVDRHGVLGSFSAIREPLTHKPLVVLVNHGTASASEILAGALQDSGRAKLVGETTFGKGSIQSLFDLSDGSGIAVTIATYETPSHRNINKVGIQPDYEVSPDTDAAVAAAAIAQDPLDTQYAFASNLLTKPQAIAGAVR